MNWVAVVWLPFIWPLVRLGFQCGRQPTKRQRHPGNSQSGDHPALSNCDRDKHAHVYAGVKGECNSNGDAPITTGNDLGRRDNFSIANGIIFYDELLMAQALDK